MDLLAESRLTFRLAQGHTVQPVAMVSGKQVCRHQDVSKESQTRGHSVRIVGNLMLNRSVPSVSVVLVQAKPRQNGQMCRPHLGATRATPQSCTTIHLVHSLSVSATQIDTKKKKAAWSGTTGDNYYCRI